MGKQNKKSTNLFSVSEFSSNIFSLFKLIYFISNDGSCEAKFICVRHFNLYFNIQFWSRNFKRRVTTEWQILKPN
jgi:hypothetical protein